VSYDPDYHSPADCQLGGCISCEAKATPAGALDQQVVLNDGETLDDVALELIGAHGKATYEVIGYQEPGDQHPTIRFYGTPNQLGAVAGRASGSAIGKPRKAS
jgi:hypothetical protein